VPAAHISTGDNTPITEDTKEPLCTKF